MVGTNPVVGLLSDVEVAEFLPSGLSPRATTVGLVVSLAILFAP
jgi:hypothetical protein